MLADTMNSPRVVSIGIRSASWTRLATRAASLPDWVIDYLLVHEMAHLEHSDHGAGFHELENRFPLTERARGYLMAIDQGATVRT